MLKSHPDKSLQQHVDEVRLAAQRIWDCHSEALRNNLPLIEHWWNLAVTFHDAGKASAPFQEYIPSPENYTGDKRHKAHTPLSALIALQQSKSESWDWRQTLCVSAACSGHHSRFKTYEELSVPFQSVSWISVFEKQLDCLPWRQLSDSIRCQLTEFEFDVNAIYDVAEYLEELFEVSLWIIGATDGVQFRMSCQLVHSILLEADKAFLIIGGNERSLYRDQSCRKLPPKLVCEFIASKQTDSKINSLRMEIRQSLLAKLESAGDLPRLSTMTLPTGSGKTLLAASWLLTMRERFQTATHTPPIIIVLPFLSIIDQTQKEYVDLLPDDSGLLAYHSLSIREHPAFRDIDDEETGEFFLDTWHGDVIVTTFDQFLFALLDPRTRYQMRFHQLADALIVMDEVQALPFKLWDIVNQSLQALTATGNAHVLAMSATQPGFLPTAIPLIENVEAVFEQLDRYELILRHREKLLLDDFAQELLRRTLDWIEDRVLVVLNTRKSARFVRDVLVNEGHEVFFLTADVTPMERLEVIGKIKQSSSCIVVATQCVEAGVDIDMTHVIRDFAPLDSLIQIAGRCNRHAERERERVEIVWLSDENGKEFSSRIYDKFLLQETRRVLDEFTSTSGNSIAENRVLELSTRYFELASNGKDTGIEITKKFARWEDFGDVRKLLRGDQNEQVSFLVIQQMPELEALLADAAKLTGPDQRWKRRRAIRRLAGKLAQVTVSIYKTSTREIDISNFSRMDPTGNFNLLDAGYYLEGRGLDLNGYDDAPLASWGACI